MTQISVKLSDHDYQLLQRLRGTKSTSGYIRDLLYANDKTVGREARAFESLFSDVSTIKDSIAALPRQLPTQDALIAVTAYLAHAIMINPAYARHTAELSDLFQQLKVTVKSGGHQ